jgi:streptogrisin C
VRNRTLLQLAASLALAGPGAASAAAQLVAPTPRVQTAVEALAQDAAEYARLNGVGLAEAMRRLRAQEESVAATERLQTLYRDRLAGISIEHHPDYRTAIL